MKNIYNKLNPNYRHGKTLKKYHCKDCGKSISLTSGLYGKQRCKKCNRKYLSSIMIGINAAHYIHGKAKNNKCVDCGKRINFGYTRCRICANIESSVIRMKNRISFKGRNNPNFKDWISREPYSLKWTTELKESIRTRDNYKCNLCNKFGNHVHHIDYNKQNCEDSNLITLCNRHHLLTNSNRDYWFAYFTYIMETK
jgi:hypothetical protein